MAAIPIADPALGLAIVTCMDARLDLNLALGLRSGDAHILRNAGGRVTDDVIRSLYLSVHLMKVREVGIVHHTNCGLYGTDNHTLASRTGVDNVDFLPFPSLSVSLNEDIDAVLRAGVVPPSGMVWGAVYRLGVNKVSVLRPPIVVGYS